MKYFLTLFTLTLFIFLYSCQNNNEKYNAPEALSDSVSITGLPPEQVKLVKTASINFKVADVERTTRDISGLARRSGGMIFQQSFESVENNRKELKISDDSLLVITTTTPHAEITARVPSDSLEEFMFSVADLGYFTGSSRLQIDDKSLAYLEKALKQKNRKEVLSQSTPKKKYSDDLQTIEVKDQVVDQIISNMGIDADARYSAVTLSLVQNPMVRKEVIANYVISDYQLPFSQRFNNALDAGWQFFLGFILAFVHVWVFILAAVIIFITYRYYQKKKKLTGSFVKAG